MREDGEGEIYDEMGMVKEVEDVRNLGKRDVDLHKGWDFGLRGGGGVDGVDESGSGGSVNFRSMILVCGRGGLFRTGFFIVEGDIFKLGGGFCGGGGGGGGGNEVGHS